MPLPVSLKVVADELGSITDEHTLYLDKRTGEIVLLSDEEFAIAEEEGDFDVPEWQEKLILKAREVLHTAYFVELPNKFDRNDYSIMERFCHSQDNRELSETLESAIRGNGAFRRFQDLIHLHGIENEWYQFENLAHQDIAADWLDANTIPYTRDEIGNKQA